MTKCDVCDREAHWVPLLSDLIYESGKPGASRLVGDMPFCERHKRMLSDLIRERRSDVEHHLEWQSLHD